MSEPIPRSDARILNRRTLERDHRRLAALLQPGMSVLDVGCGTGAITADIARAVGPEGRVVGVDRDEALLGEAQEKYGALANLRFVAADILTLTLDADQPPFDIVNAARTLQWTSAPAQAIARMRDAAKPGGGRIVVLDYNHDENSWEPKPPAEFARFYEAFLAWRSANGWSNRMASAVPALFLAAGIPHIQVHGADEVTERADPQFHEAAEIWTQVIEKLGPQLVTAGFLSPAERDQAESVYREWVQTSLERQVLQLRTVEGVVP